MNIRLADGESNPISRDSSFDQRRSWPLDWEFGSIEVSNSKEVLDWPLKDGLDFIDNSQSWIVAFFLSY